MKQYMLLILLVVVVRLPIFGQIKQTFTLAGTNVYEGGWLLKNQNRETLDIAQLISVIENSTIYVVGEGVKATRLIFLQRGWAPCHGQKNTEPTIREIIDGHKIVFTPELQVITYKNRKTVIYIAEAVNERTGKKVKVKNRFIYIKLKF